MDWINIKPTPCNFSSQYSACGCSCENNKTENYKQDCRFYCEDNDMGAIIPYCSFYIYNHGPDYFPCEKCEKYERKKYVSIIEKDFEEDY